MGSQTEMPAFWIFLGRWLGEHDWSQAKFADEVGVHQTVVGRWLHADPRRRARPGRRIVPRLAAVLAIPVEQVLLMLLADAPDAGRMGVSLLEPTTDVESDATDRVVRARMQQFASIVASYPRALRVAVIEANIRMAEAFKSLAAASDSLPPLSEAADGGTTIKNPSQAPISRPNKGLNRGSESSNDGLVSPHRLAPALIGSS